MSPARGRARPATPAAPAGPPPSPLLRTALATLHRVEAVRGHDAALQHAEARRADRALRAAVAGHPVRRNDAPGVSAVRVACAHLAVGDLDAAHQALVTARELLR